MSNKAKYIGKLRDKYSPKVTLFYEYRGCEYIVTDEHNGYSKTMRQKHEEQQSRIDSMLDRKEPADKHEFNINEVWEILGW